MLIRSKRRWVLTTIELEEESPGPFPVKITKVGHYKRLIYELGVWDKYIRIWKIQTPQISESIKSHRTVFFVEITVNEKGGSLTNNFLF